MTSVTTCCLSGGCAVVVKSVVMSVEAGTASPELTTAVKDNGRVHMQRVCPVFLSNAWSNSLMQKGQLDADTQGYLFELKDSLPNVISQQTRTTLVRFLQPLLGSGLDGIAELSFTVKQIVETVFNFDAIMCWDVVDPSLACTGHDTLIPYTASTQLDKDGKLREYAGEVEKLVRSVAISRPVPSTSQKLTLSPTTESLEDEPGASDCTSQQVSARRVAINCAGVN